MDVQYVMDECSQCMERSLVAVFLGQASDALAESEANEKVFEWHCPRCENTTKRPFTWSGVHTS